MEMEMDDDEEEDIEGEEDLEDDGEEMDGEEEEEEEELEEDGEEDDDYRGVAYGTETLPTERGEGEEDAMEEEEEEALPGTQDATQTSSIKPHSRASTPELPAEAIVPHDEEDGSAVGEEGEEAGEARGAQN